MVYVSTLIFRLIWATITLQLINHGVSISLLENVKKGAQEFFNLPMEDKKKKLWQREDIQCYGQAFVVSEEQELEWADMFFMLTLPSYIRKPHLFPNIPLPFRFLFLSVTHIHLHALILPACVFGLTFELNYFDHPFNYLYIKTCNLLCFYQSVIL